MTYVIIIGSPESIPPFAEAYPNWNIQNVQNLTELWSGLEEETISTDTEIVIFNNYLFEENSVELEATVNMFAQEVPVIFMLSQVEAGFWIKERVSKFCRDNNEHDVTFYFANPNSLSEDIDIAIIDYNLSNKSLSPTSSDSVSYVSNIASLVNNYALNFLDVLPNGHSVSSPLGVWLLLALLAPYSEGENREQLEIILGDSAEKSSNIAVDFLQSLPEDIKGSIGLWYREDFLDKTTLETFLNKLPSIVSVEDSMSQRQLDSWAKEKTLGIINSFPVEIEDLTALIFASAIATKVSWKNPFEEKRLFTTGKFAQTEGMVSTYEHTTAIYDTSYGLFGVHKAESTRGLEVYSIISESPNLPQKFAQKAALEITSGKASRVSLYDLPLGDLSVWQVNESISEYEDIDSEDNIERIEAVVAAWEVESRYDLKEMNILGILQASNILGTLLKNPDDYNFNAAQVAHAKYNMKGFEAAAITSFVVERGGLPEYKKVTVRDAKIIFDNPYTVIATSKNNQKENIPVFIAWVETPSIPTDF